MLYAVIGYDEDWYTFETFIGVFSTREKAQECIDNDYVEEDERYHNHESYEICEITIDKPIE